METAVVQQALLSFLLGAISSYLGLYWKIRKELEAEYDKDLRAERLKAYAELWKLLQPLAKYSPPGPVTPSSLQKLSSGLRQWYFESGGIFLSQKTRDAYFALQDAVVEKITVGRDIPERPLPEEEFEHIRGKGSKLRTAITEDVGSRRPPMIGGEDKLA